MYGSYNNAAMFNNSTASSGGMSGGGRASSYHGNNTSSSSYNGTTRYPESPFVAQNSALIQQHLKENMQRDFGKSGREGDLASLGWAIVSRFDSHFILILPLFYPHLILISDWHELTFSLRR